VKDTRRLELYLETLRRETHEVQEALGLSEEEIQSMPLVLRGLKYSMIVIAEVIAEICQHILAKLHKTSVSGFGETLSKAMARGVIPKELYARLSPFLQFKNLLVHGYWKVDDALFLRNLLQGVGDFLAFAEHIEHQFVAEALGPAAPTTE